MKKSREIQKFAEDRGVKIDPEMLIQSSKESGTTDRRSNVKPKYRYVDENGKEYLWSGRGVSPKWAQKIKADEGSLDKYKI